MIRKSYHQRAHVCVVRELCGDAVEIFDSDKFCLQPLLTQAKFYDNIP